MTPKSLVLAAIVVVSVPHMVSGQLSGMPLVNEIAKRPELSEVSRYIDRIILEFVDFVQNATAEMFDLKLASRILMIVKNQSNIHLSGLKRNNS